ncbi:MAG: hypothetical protein V4591_07875 [Bdellovibrionota bacterium]
MLAIKQPPTLPPTPPSTLSVSSLSETKDTASPYFPSVPSSPSPKPFLDQTRETLTQLLEKYGDLLYGSESEAYEQCITKNNNLIGDILNKIAFLEENTGETFVRGQSNVQVEAVRSGSSRDVGYVVMIFNENKISSGEHSSIVTGSQKLIKKNVYRIRIYKDKEKDISMGDYVSIAQSSPIIKTRNALAIAIRGNQNEEEKKVLERRLTGIDRVLKQDGFTAIAKISKGIKKSPFERSIFIAKNHGTDFMYARTKFNANQRREIGELHIRQAFEMIIKCNYEFFDNKEENTLVCECTTESGELSFQVTHIDYSMPSVTPDCIITRLPRNKDLQIEI